MATSLQAVQPVEAPGAAVPPRPASSDDGFTMLLSVHRAPLVAFLRAHTRCAATAEDLAQEALIRAWSAQGSFEPSRPLWPWLKAIASRVLASHFRHARTQVPSVGHDETVTDSPSASEADQSELVAERELLSVALASLPARQRVALMLRYVEGWQAGTIGGVLGLNRTSTEQLLMRGRRALAREYTRLDTARSRDDARARSHRQ